MTICVRAILPLVGLFAFATTARADAPAPDPRQVARVVANLSAEQWSARRDALEWLITAGPGADLPLRRFLDRTNNPEARMWAQRVLDRTGRIRRVEPARVTLTFDQVDIRTAFERIADIEGAALPTDPPDLLATCAGAITARYDGQTYWQTMLDLCRRADLELRSGRQGIVLARKEPGTSSHDASGCSGAFLICGRLTPWSQDPADPGRSVRIELHAEPRAQLLRGDWHVLLAEATDQHGQSLRPLAESGMNMGGSGKLADGYSWSVPLRPVATPGTRLTRIRGSVEVLLAGQIITGQAPDHAGDHTLGGPLPIHLPCSSVSASVLRVVHDGASWTMEMQVDIDPAEVEWDAVMQSLAADGLRAFDTGGHEFLLQSFWRAGEGPSSQIKCKWGPNPDPSMARPGEPFKLVWRVPGKMVRVKVPFELTDVRLVER
jgi:hypothetical protein